MKAVTFQGMQNVEVKEVPDAKIEQPDDIIVRITNRFMIMKMTALNLS